MNLVIVESPAKAKTINKYLGKDYKVLASYGHIRDLPSKNGSVDPDDVIMSPEKARERGLTSTITFPTGNLAPEGSVIKSTAIDPKVLDKEGVYRRTGIARVFHRERDAIRAIKSKGPDSINPGDIMVLTCGGPMGTGMEEVFQITAALKYLSENS